MNRSFDFSVRNMSKLHNHIGLGPRHIEPTDLAAMNTVRSILQPPNTFIMAICPCGIRADVLFSPGIMPTVEIVHKVGIGSAGDGLTIMGRGVRSSLIRDVIDALCDEMGFRCRYHDSIAYI